VPVVAALAARHGLDVVRTFGGNHHGFALMLFRHRARQPVPLPDVVAKQRLGAARARTLELVYPLDEAALTRQWSPLMSPISWDLGHIANFEEQWVRRAHSPSSGPKVGRTCGEPSSRMTRACEESTPWRSTARAPSPTSTTSAGRRPGNRTPLSADDPPCDGFVHAMLAQHEAQHTETILQTIQLAGIPYEPCAARCRRRRLVVDEGRMAYVPGDLRHGDRRPAAVRQRQPAHEVVVPAFRIDVTPVTNRAYLAFIDDGGYRRRELWGEDGWTWLQLAGVTHPAQWIRQADGTGHERAFGRVEPLLLDQPVVHVCWWEARAYARWADKRLPTEAEWEKAAAWDLERLVPRRHPWGDGPVTPERANLDQRCFAPAAAGAFPQGASYFGCQQMLGCVWEWTESDFGAYPGFEAFPYPEYSAIHFGRGYKVLRGGSWATQPLVARNTFRNWDLPQRRQIFAGFRCAADG
jgi:iron(II)-dependent oxidoreductase